MSTSPETRPVRPNDEIVTLLSEWLAFGAGTQELRDRLRAIGKSGLEGDAAEAVQDLEEELGAESATGRGQLERVVREALDAVALS
ncbi:MAG: hypothetical protein ACRDLU_05380 [Gaiellaceae bacterium]